MTIAKPTTTIRSLVSNRLLRAKDTIIDIGWYLKIKNMGLFKRVQKREGADDRKCR
jgi:hypothetical protein